MGGDARDRPGRLHRRAGLACPRRIAWTQRDDWHALLRPDETDARVAPRFAASHARAEADVRRARPLSVPAAVLSRRRRRVAHPRAAETIRRSASASRAALEPGAVSISSGSPRPRRLVGIDPGYATASTASRLDAFSCPTRCRFAEYNAESPAGSATRSGWASSSTLPVMAHVRATDVRFPS